MKRILVPGVVMILFGSPLASGYEWKSHNGAAAGARELVKKIGADASLATFLNFHGEKDLDTRAGDPFDKAFTDEDHTEGFMTELYGCRYVERDCYNFGLTLPNSLWVAPCTINHFSPRLALPFGLGDDAPVHARRYFDMAVRLYKAGKCDR